MKTLLRSVLLKLRLLITKSIFYPYFVYLDLKNGSVLRRHGDVLSTRRIRERDGGTFCVFHLYPVNGIPPSARRALETLHDLGVNVVAVSNLSLAESDEAFLEKVAHTIIIRRNIGRDFGGYKTGVLHVLSQLKPDRLVLANDSVFFMSKGLREFFQELCGPHAYVGAAENHEFGYHVGSYALGFGPQVLSDPRFHRFWSDYRCSELRPQVIKPYAATLSVPATSQSAARTRRKMVRHHRCPSHVRLV